MSVDEGNVDPEITPSGLEGDEGEAGTESMPSRGTLETRVARSSEVPTYGPFRSGDGNLPEGYYQAKPEVVPEGWKKEDWTTFCTALSYGADFQQLVASLEHLFR